VYLLSTAPQTDGLGLKLAAVEFVKDLDKE
jgi:hypothetical protein